jgi:hypothetical protein
LEREERDGRFDLSFQIFLINEMISGVERWVT